MDLTGFALVTGAGSGIGRDVSLAFAYEGVQGLLLADIDEPSMASTLADCQSVATNSKFQAYSYKVDVTSESSAASMVALALEKFGRIDYCVNSAGVGVEKPASVSEASLSEFERFWNVNVKGVLHCLKAQTAAMQSQEPLISHRGRSGTPRDMGRGSIVNLGSCNSYVATPHIVQYTSAKHAVLGMTRTAALDMIPHGIRVNAICPAWVETPMIEKALAGSEDLRDLMSRVVPMKRIAHPEEVSDVIMFLCSGKSSYVTGAGWIVDGGITLSSLT